jgi:glycosyltransferase involved in cell wall biosynthesis
LTDNRALSYLPVQPSPDRELMTVSGFTFVRDAVRLDFPLRESITSVLPICDEFIVNVGRSNDGTRRLVDAIGSPKLVVFESDWDPALFVKGAINAQQTNLALDRCTGDWCFYLQADEVVHEDELERIRDCMRRSTDRSGVEALSLLPLLGELRSVPNESRMVRSRDQGRAQRSGHSLLEERAELQAQRSQASCRRL